MLNLDKDDHERRDAQEDFDAEKESLAETYADLKNAVAENDQLLDEELIALLGAVSNLEAASARVTAAEATMDLYELKAPFNGVLLSMDLTIGETVIPMLPVAFVADTSRWIVETKDLAEIDVANISIGDVAVIKLDVFPGEEFTGTVAEIDPVGMEHLGDMTYKTTLTLNESDPGFLWNMTATVTIAVK